MHPTLNPSSLCVGPRASIDTGRPNTGKPPPPKKNNQGNQVFNLGQRSTMVGTLQIHSNSTSCMTRQSSDTH